MSTKVFLIVFGFAFFVFPLQAVFASTGTISGYAWSSQIGSVNFGTSNGSATVTDSAITGWAWNENFGRINLNPTNGGRGSRQGLSAAEPQPKRHQF